jgi:hypothetical protein
MYELVDSLTYKLRSISAQMWPVFELTYRLFKHEAVDFLEGISIGIARSGICNIITIFVIFLHRNVAFPGQFLVIWLRRYQVARRL